MDGLQNYILKAKKNKIKTHFRLLTSKFRNELDSLKATKKKQRMIEAIKVLFQLVLVTNLLCVFEANLPSYKMYTDSFGQSPSGLFRH